MGVFSQALLSYFTIRENLKNWIKINYDCDEENIIPNSLCYLID